MSRYLYSTRYENVVFITISRNKEIILPSTSLRVCALTFLQVNDVRSLKRRDPEYLGSFLQTVWRWKGGPTKALVNRRTKKTTMTKSDEGSLILIFMKNIVANSYGRHSTWGSRCLFAWTSYCGLGETQTPGGVQTTTARYDGTPRWGVEGQNSTVLSETFWLSETFTEEVTKWGCFGVF